MSEPLAQAEPLVAVRDLHRHFDNVKAVQGLSFNIRKGEVVGFIGANGAGKTTTMRIMATLDMPTAGEVRIGGHNIAHFPREVRRLIGWMPDSYGTYSHTTVGEYLDFYARAFHFRGSERTRRVAEVMEYTNLGPLAERPINTLSKGMAQRLCLGRTLLHDPEFLILDEPAAGLDPQARIEFKHLVRLLAEEGKTLFISSHILSELGEMCDTLLFLDGGRAIYHGSAESLLNGEGQGAVYRVRVADDPRALQAWAPLQPGVSLLEATRHGARLKLEHDTPEGVAAVLRRMVCDGIAVTEYHREESKLEDAFVAILTQEKTPPQSPQPAQLPLPATPSTP